MRRKPEDRRAAFEAGFFLGVFQAHAFLGPIGILILWTLDRALIYVLLIALSTSLGWWGWYKFYQLSWTVQPEHLHR